MKKVAFIQRGRGAHWVGDGFPVQTLFSYDDLAAQLSPFLLLDYAGPTEFPPATSKRGVGPHPHRGFETVTIVYAGGVAHRDSAGGGGSIGPGEVQWMTAGSGVLHEEYHSLEYAAQGGAFEMVQLWVNLPARDKMTEPRYQAISSDRIPDVALPGRAGRARIIAGAYGTARGPARTFTPMNVWDLRLAAGGHVPFDLPEGHTTALLVLNGVIRVDDRDVGAAELVVLERSGNVIVIETVEDATVLLLNGAPLDEPIVGQGPFVMNTRAEIAQAIRDFNDGRFGRMVR